MPLYKVETEQSTLRLFRAIPLGDHHTESKLEDWLEQSPEVLIGDEPLLIIGRQVNTPVGILDLLALDSSGNCVVIELKRAPTQREAVSQGLEYASWAASLDFSSIEEVATSYFRGQGIEKDLHQAWVDTYGTELKPAHINEIQRIFVVIEGEDARLTRLVKYLRATGVDISLFRYDFYRSDGGEELLNIHLDVGEQESSPQEEQKPNEQRLLESWSDRLEESYEAFRDKLFEGGLYSQPKKSGMSFLVQTKKWPVFVCFFNQSSTGASIWIRADSMSATYDFASSAKAIQAELPNGSIAKQTDVWYMISFQPTPGNGASIANSILGHIVEPVLSKMNS